MPIRRKSFLATLLAVFIAACLVVALRGGAQPAPASTADRELTDLRARMDAEKKALDEIMKRRGGVIGKMEAVRAQLARSAARITRCEQDQKIAAAESQELTTRMAEADARMKAKRRDLARRLRARYQFGRQGLLRLWLQAGDLSDLSRRRHYLDATFRADAGRIEDYKKLLAEWTLARKNLDERQRKMAGIELVVREQRVSMEAERQTLIGLLKSVEEERSAHEEMLAELRARDANLRGVLAGLDRQSERKPPPPPPPPEPEPGSTAAPEPPPEPPAAPGVDFQSLAGRLCMPASGPITSAFGQKVHPKFGTVIMQNGIEIGAGAGSSVRAVAAGTVRFADWFRGYGNLVIIDHGDGWFTLYAHLADIRVSVGQEVGKGKVVGSVGDTGSMTGANLYFEIRHHQTPQNPAAWLGACTP